MGVWLVSYLLEPPHVSLLRIYPSPNTRRLPEAFALDANHRPTVATWESLQSFETGDRDYLVLDRHGLVRAVDAIGGLPFPDGVRDGISAVATLPTTAGDMDTAIQAHQTYLQALCRRLEDLPVTFSFDLLLHALRPPRAYVGLDRGARQAMEVLLSRNLRCTTVP